MNKKIAFGNDHTGMAIKKTVLSLLKKDGWEVMDYGSYNDDSVDYPDFAHPVATAIKKGNCSMGILLCGSGNGVAMTANKHVGIRAAVCWTSELASLARQHNNANILCLPARFVDSTSVEKIVLAFLHTLFEGGRHKRRVDKING